MSTSKAVRYSWHQENCSEPCLHGHPEESHYVCTTCGREVQLESFEEKKEICSGYQETCHTCIHGTSFDDDCELIRR